MRTKVEFLVRKKVLGHATLLALPSEGCIGPVNTVLEGEYECWLNGRGLNILDLGAHVGSFAIWAMHRYPGSTVDCYEPVSGTFELLKRNTEFYRKWILPHNAMVTTQPGPRAEITYDTRCLTRAGFFKPAIAPAVAGALKTEWVNVVHPGRFASFDMIKIDVEGRDFEVLNALDLRGVTVVHIEPHTQDNWNNIAALMLCRGFYLRSANLPPNMGGVATFIRKDLGAKFEDIWVNADEAPVLDL